MSYYSDEDEYSDDEYYYQDYDEEEETKRIMEEYEEEQRLKEEEEKKPKLNKYQQMRIDMRLKDEARRKKAKEDEIFEQTQLETISNEINKFNKETELVFQEINKLRNKDFTGPDGQILASAILEVIKNRYVRQALNSYNMYIKIFDDIQRRIGYERRSQLEKEYNIDAEFKKIYQNVLDTLAEAVTSSKGLNTPKIKGILTTIINGFTKDIWSNIIIPEELSNVGYEVSYEDYIESNLDQTTINMIIDSMRQQGFSDDDIIEELSNTFYLSYDDAFDYLQDKK